MCSGRKGKLSSIISFDLDPIYRSKRMATAKEKARAHRRKTIANKETVSTKLVEPLTASTSPTVEKIKVKTSVRSALIPSEGKSMGMEID